MIFVVGVGFVCFVCVCVVCVLCVCVCALCVCLCVCFSCSSRVLRVCFVCMLCVFVCACVIVSVCVLFIRVYVSKWQKLYARGTACKGRLGGA